MGRLKSRKSESLGLVEAVALKCELFAEVVEAGELLVIFIVPMEIGDDAPIVEGDGFDAKVLVGPFATSLNGMEKLGGSVGDGERGVVRGGEDFFDVLLFVQTQFASDADSLCIIKGVEGADICGEEFKIVMDRDEELRYLTVVLDELERMLSGSMGCR